MKTYRIEKLVRELNKDTAGHISTHAEENTKTHRWSDTEINTLLVHAKRVFNADIPLSKEIAHLKHFIWEINVFWGPDDSARIEKTITGTRTVFKWFHRGFVNSQTIELPEDAVWCIMEEMRDRLNMKCDFLSDLSKFERKEE